MAASEAPPQEVDFPCGYCGKWKREVNPTVACLVIGRNGRERWGTGAVCRSCVTLVPRGKVLGPLEGDQEMKRCLLEEYRRLNEKRVRRQQRKRKEKRVLHGCR